MEKTTMIDIDMTRYAKITRGRALQILEHADIKPDKFTAHRNRTFTAKYLRDRLPLFSSPRYEERMEIASDNGIAIFKRPNSRIDRGRYITLKFAVAEFDKLGLPRIPLTDAGTARTEPSSQSLAPTPAEVAVPAPAPATSGRTVETGQAALLNRLTGVARDLKQLARYAHELIEKDAGDKESPHRKHALTVLDELSKQIEVLIQGLQQLMPP